MNMEAGNIYGMMAKAIIQGIAEQSIGGSRNENEMANLKMLYELNKVDQAVVNPGAVEQANQ